MQGDRFHIVDLTKIKGKGDFKCPKCGISISPDDRTEDLYTIIEPVMKGASLEKIIIQCKTCKTQIHLTGFRIMSGVR